MKNGWLSHMLEGLKGKLRKFIRFIDIRGIEVDQSELSSVTNDFNHNQEDRCYFIVKHEIQGAKYIIWEDVIVKTIDAYESTELELYVTRQIQDWQSNMTIVSHEKGEIVKGLGSQKCPSYLTLNSSTFWVRKDGQYGVLVPSFRDFELDYNFEGFETYQIIWENAAIPLKNPKGTIMISATHPLNAKFVTNVGATEIRIFPVDKDEYGRKIEQQNAISMN